MINRLLGNIDLGGSLEALRNWIKKAFYMEWHKCRLGVRRARYLRRLDLTPHFVPSQSKQPVVINQQESDQIFISDCEEPLFLRSKKHSKINLFEVYCVA